MVAVCLLHSIFFFFFLSPIRLLSFICCITAIFINISYYVTVLLQFLLPVFLVYCTVFLLCVKFVFLWFMWFYWISIQCFEFFFFFYNAKYSSLEQLILIESRVGYKQ